MQLDGHWFYHMKDAQVFCKKTIWKPLTVLLMYRNIMNLRFWNIIKTGWYFQIMSFLKVLVLTLSANRCPFVWNLSQITSISTNSQILIFWDIIKMKGDFRLVSSQNVSKLTKLSGGYALHRKKVTKVSISRRYRIWGNFDILWYL